MPGKTVAAHHGCLRNHDIPPELPAGPGSAADLAEKAEAAQAERRQNSALLTRTRQRYEAVHVLKAPGKGIKTIMRELRLVTQIVRRFYRAADVAELLARPHAGRPSVLDTYKPYLLKRCNAGVTNTSALYREIIEQGYRGSQATVAAYLAPFRALDAAPPITAVVPTVRHIASWILRHPDDLDAEQQLQLTQMHTSCPHPDTAAAHVAAFAEILTGRHAAVLNGLTLPYSSGAVEGTVNRIKIIKRQMYGCAKFDLLRKRVLLAA